MNDDAHLLQAYAERGSQEAFTELVHRYLDVVHSAALRQVGGDTHRAREVTQSVFTDLARKAEKLSRHPAVLGWLYTSTHYAAAKIARSEQRRRTREQEVHAMNEVSSEQSVDWAALQPVLDAAMLELSDHERRAVLFRFFGKLSLADVGARLGVSENGARKSIERGLEKLRTRLARRGVTSTAVALAVVLSEQVVTAAPAGLAATVSSAALTSAASVTATGGILAFMSMTKLEITALSALALAGTTGLGVHRQANTSLAADLDGLRQQRTEMATIARENTRLAAASADVAQFQRDIGELAQLRTQVATLRKGLARTLRAPENSLAAIQDLRRGTSVPDDVPLPTEIFDLSQVERQPRIRFRAGTNLLDIENPVLPAEVVLEFIVDAEGNTRAVRAVASSQREFEAPTIEAAKKWQFVPARNPGKNVAVRMQQRIVYEADPTAEPTQPAK